MTARNTLKLKELIFNTLNNDMTLRGLLGGTGRVRHANPQQLSEYPLVVYSIIEETDNAFNDAQGTNIVKTRLIVETFSTQISSAQSDAIDDRVYTLLNGQGLSNSSVQVYSIYRDSRTPIYEPDIKVWRVQSAYNINNSTL
jgi:hypothetical protein